MLFCFGLGYTAFEALKSPRVAHVEVVELLLRGGADLTPRDIERMSALDLARAAGHGAVAELLRRHGAE